MESNYWKLWVHSPVLTAEPEKILKFHYVEIDEKLDIYGIVKLKNNKFLYIKVNTLVNDTLSGFSQVLEFDDLEEAEEIYYNFIGDN